MVCFSSFVVRELLEGIHCHTTCIKRCARPSWQSERFGHSVYTQQAKVCAIQLAPYHGYDNEERTIDLLLHDLKYVMSRKVHLWWFWRARRRSPLLSLVLFSLAYA